ncbi:hypothetical protein, conserved [Babesia bigemina]|uniref:Exportin-5 C-terminal domain-containing protein n=1 Tax=Babesia bigemina TaxID=5866 RepID=A0A061DAT3_BABBI|nr:hypothetical protein, conserved [Babesia bigemina]CDR96029.1 hypothetical protein, conserved [Babesia bigemina]|eukprot:XP_012768215.1 hypothetical protein, conserved [Babesia bigemina]
MFREEVVAAVFAAHEGSYVATQRLQQLVECRDDPADPAMALELQRQLALAYDALISLTQISHNSRDEAVLAFVSTKGAAATRENYIECVDLLRFYGFTLLVKFVENHWHRLPDELRRRCKGDMERLFSCGRGEPTVAAEYNALAAPKVSQYVATIAIREWPVSWHEFIPLCLQSLNARFASLGGKANECKQTLAELCIFGGLLSEISVDITDCMDNKVLYKKRTQILGLFQNHICEIFLMIHRVIVLGMLNGQPQILQMVISIFRNLSGIMDGFVFVEFDVDDFLRANIDVTNRSDVIQTLHNICTNVVRKPLKNMPKSPDFDLSNDAYKLKLNRFVRNLVSVGESMQLDCSLETACDQLQLTQAIKVLFERNGVYVLTNLDVDSLKLLVEYLQGHLVMHPSMQIATCAVTALNGMLRRVGALGEARLCGEYHSGVFVPNPCVRWLDHRRMLLVLFVRCLKMGNTALSENAEHPSSSSTIDEFIAESVGTYHVRSQRWSKLLFAYVPIDDEFCVGQLKNFEPRFAALRSAILNCVSLLCTVSHDYMNACIKALADIFTTAQRVVMDAPCVHAASICTIQNISEKRLQWTCKKLVLFDGTCFMFEAALSRLRGATIDVTTTVDNTKTPEWMQPAAANSVLQAAQAKAGGNMVDTWISTGLTYLLHMLGLQLPSVHGAQLEVRRLGMLSSSAILLLYNSEPTERILEYVVGLLLVQGAGDGHVTKVHRSALVTLISLCKSCSGLVSAYVEPIVQRIRQCLNVAEDESARDLLLESLVALTSCLQNFETQRRLTNEIIAPYVDDIAALATKVSSVKLEERPAMLFAFLYGSGPNPASASGSPAREATDEESLDRRRRNLRRVFTMSLSIIRCCVVPNSPEERSKANHAERVPVRHPLEDRLLDIFVSTCTILRALSGMWRPGFRTQDDWRKVVLSPGEEEWISLQGFNEAIATEESLRRLVESVFSIPSTMDAKLVRKCRRHDFLLRQSALKLCGEIFSTAITFKIDLVPHAEAVVMEALVEPLEWISMSHLAQYLKFALVPSKLSLRNVLSKVISTISERINAEWKALNRLQRNLLAGDEGAAANRSAESRILHLYYLRVYASIETGLQLMALVATAFRIRCLHALENESEAGSDEVVMMGTPGSEQVSVVFGSRELLTCILQCLCSALCWPHCRCVTEALRLLRTYAKIAPTMDSYSVSIAESFASEVLLVLHKQLRIERTFDPLNLGNDEGHGSTTTAYKRFWSNTRDGSTNYIKEFVNTMSTFYECLVKCQPGVTGVLNQGEINVQALLRFSSVVEAVKLLTPYLQEHECLNFLTKIISHNSVESRALLQAGIEANVLDQNARANAKMLQFTASILETRSAMEIERSGSGESDDEFLGSDIAYLLFE